MAALDADLVDEPLEGDLSGCGVHARVEDVGDLLLEQFEFMRARGAVAVRVVLDGGEEFVPRDTQLADLLAQLVDALAALRLRERSRLERGEVALDGILGLANLRLDLAELILVRGARLGGGARGLVDGAFSTSGSANTRASDASTASSSASAGRRSLSHSHLPRFFVDMQT